MKIGFWRKVMLLVAGLMVMGPKRFSEVLAESIAGTARRRLSWMGKVVFFLVERRSREPLAGDLEEEYVTTIVRTRGYLRARFWWWRQVLKIIGPYLWKRLSRMLGFEAVRGLRRR